jgi:eukaryotic-like serine/threonine-protein kinase
MSHVLMQLSSALADRYVIEREIGAGGMATVFLARDLRHDRRVAIKVLSPEWSASIGTERFSKEIAVTAGLQHPNILPLFDSGTTGETLFYVMPYVEGETLRGRLQRERQLPVSDAVRIAVELADALEHAHQHGVIHRDIKPENILLRDGRPLIADFGIALAAAQANGGRLTQTGLSVGTPAYMSPEQATGERTIDARTDVFALAVVLYEMLAGDPPFTGPTVQAVVARIMSTEPTPITDLRKSVPPHVALAIAAALEKVPADRPASAAAFAAALTHAEAVSPAARSMLSGGRSSVARRIAMVGGAALVGAAGLFAGRALDRPADVGPTSTVRFLLNPPDSVELQAVCCGQMFTLSADGQTVVFQGRRRVKAGQPPAEIELYVRRLDDLEVRRLPGTGGAASISISPDGRRVAFAERQQLSLVELRGASPTMVATLPAGFIGGTTWLTNDSIVVAVGTSLLVIDVRGGGRRVLYGPDPRGRQPAGPQWVESGRGFLFTLGSLDTRPEVHWLPEGSTRSKRIMYGATPRFLATTRRMFVLQGTSLMSFPFDATKADTTGAGALVTDGVVLRSPIQVYGEYAIAENGTLAVARRAGTAAAGAVGVVSGMRDTLVNLLERGQLGGIRFSPDGRRMASFVGDLQLDKRDPTRQLLIWDIARGVSQRIFDGAPAREPRWNATSDSLLYLSDNQLFIRAADGSGTARSIVALTGWANVRNFTWHAPWLVIAGQRDAAGSSDIGVVQLGATSSPQSFLDAPAEETEPELSPDGKWLAYTSNDGQSAEIYVSPFPVASARYRVSTGGGRQARWSPDGRTLYFAGNNGFYATPVSYSGSAPTFGTPRSIYQRGYARAWDMSPDGATLAFIDTVRLLELLGIEIVVPNAASGWSAP